MSLYLKIRCHWVVFWEPALNRHPDKLNTQTGIFIFMKIFKNTQRKWHMVLDNNTNVLTEDYTIKTQILNFGALSGV